MSSLANNPFPVKTVILVGDKDFGRCPVSSRLNRALWPVFGKPALQSLLEQLAEQGIRRVIVSCASQSDVTEKAVQCPDDMDITFQLKNLPRGPAGCILDAAEPSDQCLLVLPANMMRLPPVEELIQRHRQSQADITVFLNPEHEKASQGDDSQIYLCEPSVLGCIPPTGYFDLKEGLIPTGIQSGLKICAAGLPFDAGHYRTWRDYLAKMKLLLLDPPGDRLVTGFSRMPGNPDVWCGRNVCISPSARFFGPAAVGANTTIGDHAMIFGPAVIGSHVEIGSGCLIEESILWDRVAAAPETRIRYSLVDAGVSVKRQAVSGILLPAGKHKVRKAVAPQPQKRKSFKKNAPLREESQHRTLEYLLHKKTQKYVGFVLMLLLLGALVVSYWKPTLKSLIGIWLESDEYSSGLLVPFIVLYILWLRRKPLSQVEIRPSLAGLGLLLAAQGLRFFGLYFMFSSIERYSLVLSIGACVYFLFGWAFFKKFLPLFLFLFLMLPLPNRVESYLTLPLQAWATVSSVFCLEMLGFSVLRQGNVININGTLVAVAEACNGLRMLTAFIVVSGFVALMVNRRWPVKLAIILSSIPIALACNTLRLTITAIAFTKLDTQRWEKVFHDFGGFAMMPLALLIIVLELWLLSRLIIEPKNKQEHVIYRKKVEST